jgi:hypothetical protein
MTDDLPTGAHLVTPRGWYEYCEHFCESATMGRSCPIVEGRAPRWFAALFVHRARGYAAGHRLLSSLS